MFDHLFALFSGRRKSEYLYDERYSGRYVHVFDWDGTLQRVYEVDRDIRPLAVAASGDVLYAASLVDSAVYRYELGELTGTRKR